MSNLTDTLRKLRVLLKDIKRDVANLQDALIVETRRANDYKRAALQARDDLREIEAAFIRGIPPIGQGAKWAAWSKPANTIRWIDDLEDTDRKAMESTGTAEKKDAD